MACYNPFGFLQTTGPRNSRLHIHMYLHMPCLKMWKNTAQKDLFSSICPQTYVSAKEDQLSDCPADKLASRDVFLCLCSQAQSGILLCWGHTSKGVCPCQDFDTFLYPTIELQADKKSISQSPCSLLLYSHLCHSIRIPIFQKRSLSSAIRQFLTEVQSKWD